MLSFVGMVNGTGTDRGPAFSLDQALISQTVPVDLCTTALSWRSLIMDIGHALGSLGAGLPLLFQRQLPLELLTWYDEDSLARQFAIYDALYELSLRQAQSAARAIRPRRPALALLA